MNWDSPYQVGFYFFGGDVRFKDVTRDEVKWIMLQGLAEYLGWTRQ